MDKAIYTTEHRQLSQLLRDLRLRASLRQIDLAHRLDEPQSFVSKVESGERRLDVIELREISHALGLTLAAVVALLERRLVVEQVIPDERAALRSAERAGPAS